MDAREIRWRSEELREHTRHQRQQARLLAYQAITLIEEIDRQMRRANDLIAGGGKILHPQGGNKCRAPSSTAF